MLHGYDAENEGWQVHFSESTVFWYGIMVNGDKAIGRGCVGMKLMPYWNLDELLSGKDPLDFVEIVLNIVMFVPIGLLLAGICTQYMVWRTALIGCGMSVAIEVLQLAFRCGVCEMNDVIHNTVGCLIGAWIMRYVSDYRKRNKNE